MIQKNFSLKNKWFRGTSIALIGLVVITSFNNCGQPGSIDLKNTDLTAADIQNVTNPVTPVPMPPNNTQTPVGNPVLVPKVTSIDVGVSTNRKVDILVIIDNSGSMAFEQKNMAARFDTFIDALQNNGLDWQVGIVTTDMSGTGELRDGTLIPFLNLLSTNIKVEGKYVRVLNSSMPLATTKSAFAAAIQRPEQGSGNEQGVAAIWRAIEKSRTAKPDAASYWNKILFRDGAALAVAVITDADESPVPDQASARNNPLELLSYIKSTWPTKAVSISGIIVRSGDSVCKNTDIKVNDNEDYGVAYETLAAATGGVLGSVCDADYGSQLKILAQNTVSLVNTLALECSPADTNKDGVPDIEVLDPQNRAITSYKLKGSQIKFNGALLAGTTRARYYCLQ